MSRDGLNQENALHAKSVERILFVSLQIIFDM